ncbi:indoleamine 2,3-dioxygenase [Trichoderma arundinaceum]|uniref:Indoleamine 2,3-dioxygenase n=1 Tax=Trichoderma arundinaceum TaxID=490622 RepID=A0A395NGT0_TRIAR|nr:indoleamine 2,3-dioxygenase [Trichoderma arundinaceum]
MNSQSSSRAADVPEVALQDFNVDRRTGFVPPHMPLPRLPAEWEMWEATSDAARWQKLKAAEQLLVLDGPQKLVEEEKALAWRKRVDKMPVLSVENIKGNRRALRRAHGVLSSIVQFYAHTIPSSEPIIIPRSLTVPLLRVSKELQHAPFITYSDHALHNWSHKELQDEAALPTSDNLQSQLTFTGTPDENELYMTDVRLELKGAVAIELLRLATDEIEGGNENNVRIAEYLNQTAGVIEKMKDMLMSLKKLVRPEIFYHEVRPWLVGAGDDIWGRSWTWEDHEKVEGSEVMLTKISGPTAGQSPLVPALDAYLGIKEDDRKSLFLDRVRGYMDHEHEEFLQSLRSKNQTIRSFVKKIAKEQGVGSSVLLAYNAAIQAMKSFRDEHLIIVTLYVILPSKKKTRNVIGATSSATIENGVVQGDTSCKDVTETAKGRTGDEKKEDPAVQLMKGLKGFRDHTDQTCL